MLSVMIKWLFSLIVWVSPAWAGAQTILVLGDSISAAYGLPSIDRGWVALLQQRLADSGARVVNASIPGETTAGGLTRLAPLLAREKPAVVIVELGANDGLRGLTLDQMKANLNGIVDQAQEARAKVLLLGMRLPPNYGKRYADAFAAIFARLAEERRIAYVPFLMDGVGGQRDMMQTDGLHPNEAAQTVMMEHVWSALQPLLKDD
ncbi:MAG: arylesterase [Methylotetracoccus sp.]|nr:arylesterase [Methylotetracoccus sp.]